MKISRQPSPLQIMIDDKTGNAVLGNGGARWPDQCCRGRTMGISNCECVSVSADLTLQHAKRMFHIILSSVVCLTVPHISTLSHKTYDFREKSFMEHKICVSIFSTNFV